MFTNSGYSVMENPPIRPSVVMERPSKWIRYNTAMESAPNCPRCASSNTKFCYYNNYSLSQPRYFCKGCRRYWTKGGSLRNVPVGGGCRKSRRARATRQGNQQGSTLSPLLTGSSSEPESSTDIDLAAVFAKYVSPNVENEESSSPGSYDNYIQASPLLEMHGQFGDLINGADDQGLPQISMHEGININSQDFMYQNSNGFELQSILGDELAADALWSEGTHFPSFGPQESTVQMQDLELFSPHEDQIRISANLVCDNWGSFDLSAYEIFSRP